jgi:protein-L-isoaspartate(D-aspartate) O-methyltransferase
MVREQIEGRGIRDPRLLEAMREVPRHRFVPAVYRPLAYTDQPLPIGEGQTISQPYIVALMTSLLELQGGEKVLEVGTGSGYQAAVLSRLAGEVYTIEILPTLAWRAKQVLEGLGYTNVRVRVGDGFFGWPEAAPFDAIVVTAAAPRLPQPLWEQLAEGGRIVLPLGAGRNQRLVRFRKVDGRRIQEDFTEVLFVPMTGAVIEAPGETRR